MVHFRKKAVLLTAAGALAAMAVTGCSGSINTDGRIIDYHYSGRLPDFFAIIFYATVSETFFTPAGGYR